MTCYRHPDPAVRREMWRRRLAHFRREPFRRYGWDSLRRVRARQDAAQATRRRLWHMASVIVLVAAAVAIIGWDYEARTTHLGLHPDGVSTSAHPHPGDH